MSGRSSEEGVRFGDRPGLREPPPAGITRGGPMFEKLPAVVTSGVVAAAMLTFVVPAVHADVVASSVVLRDGPGDVWTRVSDQEEPTRADFPAADVTRVFVSHGPS